MDASSGEVRKAGGRTIAAEYVDEDIIRPEKNLIECIAPHSRRPGSAGSTFVVLRDGVGVPVTVLFWYLTLIDEPFIFSPHSLMEASSENPLPGLSHSIAHIAIHWDMPRGHRIRAGGLAVEIESLRDACRL